MEIGQLYASLLSDSKVNRCVNKLVTDMPQERESEPVTIRVTPEVATFSKLFLLLKIIL